MYKESGIIPLWDKKLYVNDKVVDAFEDYSTGANKGLRNCLSLKKFQNLLFMEK